METIRSLGLELLDRLQLQESRLLSWGMVDGFFSDDELIRHAEAVVAARHSDLDADEVVEWLEDRALVFALPGVSDRYRTRTGEAVRLFARLRQWFPNRDWETTPELVSDFHFATLPRRFPDRSITLEEGIAALRAEPGCSPLQGSVAAELMGGAGSGWKLADFQVEATARVLSEAKGDSVTGTIVCAGTGSGKTLAFYLPVFMHLAERGERTKGVSCLALYPRTELLRDQLTSAVENALRVQPVLEKAGKRAIAIGALYAGVPETSNQIDSERRHRKAWESIVCQGEPANRCPYLDCPACDAPLGWPKEDRSADRERLRCTGCALEIPGDVLRLTRESMRANPPDILFTTTESLNLGLRTSRNWSLFGIGNVEKPDLVLLDEVHTYEGAQGAQVALTLRRWRNRSGARPHFVGLSATLADASRFFSELLGLYRNKVSVVEPKALKTEGSEQILVLRGKPGTATLSTTIQSAMLLRRVLDSSPPKSEGIAGQHVFVFTDKLDVTNRLLNQLSNAEGWRVTRGAPIATTAPLAHLRSRNGAGTGQRIAAGQSWDLVHEIGHNLGPEGRVKVARTSAQDRGVQKDADIIVTTPALEVGFDDPLLGGIIQHQAPKDPAAYLQRKGRAGRTREMRPWTVVVLSDEGQDRAAYRAYENLFSPSVPLRYLPIRNRHILRMQASFFFLDWLAQTFPKANIVKGLGGQGNESNRFRALLKRLLENDHERSRFLTRLRSGLGLETDEEAEALLWEPPRSLAFSLWPTVLRRLETKWESEEKPNAARSPLPEHAPSNLFADLNLPEVVVELEGSAGVDESSDSLPSAQALTEFAPGKVSLRYTLNTSERGRWVPVAAPDLKPLDLAEFCTPDVDSVALGSSWYFEQGNLQSVPVFRPDKLRLQRVPRGVSDRSSGIPLWDTQLLPSGPATPIEVPPKNEWRDLFSSIDVYSHLHGNPLETRRFTRGADVTLKDDIPPFQEHRGFVPYEATLNGQTGPAALGFVVDVDAICIRLDLHGDLHQRVNEDSALLRSQRVAVFYHSVQSDPTLKELANVFERRHLADLFLVAVLYRVDSKAMDLMESIRIVEDEADLSHVALGELPDSDGDQDSGEVREARQANSKARERLEQLWMQPKVRGVLASAARRLARPLSSDDEPFLNEAVKATVGGAMLNACQRMCPEVVANDLAVDLDPGPGENSERREAEVWLSETTVGGAAVVEAFYRAAAFDPRRLLQLFEAELEPSDFEEVDYYLTLLVRLIDPADSDYDAVLSAIITDIRSAGDFEAQASQFEKLLEELDERGLSTNHSVVSAISLRLLRPGSTRESDDIIRLLLARRNAFEASHGIELDGRVAAKLFGMDSTLLPRLQTAFPQLNLHSVDARESLIASLLWPRGVEVRQRSLKSWNRFTTNPPAADRLLLHALVPHGPTTVELESDGWRESLEERLFQAGRGGLSAPLDQARAMRAAILDLARRPFDNGSIVIYPRVVAQKRDFGRMIVVFDLPEAFQ